MSPADVAAALSSSCNSWSAASQTAAPGLTSVVIVTSDSGAGVSDCVARVLASHAVVEVILVDNNSRDGGPLLIAQRFAENPQIRILHNDKNTGFGAACNRGVSIARGDTLVLLNPDCLIEADTIARLRAIADADPHVAIVGALQVDATGQIDPASRRRDPLLYRAVMSLSGLARYASRTPALDGIALPVVDAVDAVDAISGALMLIPRVIFDQLQGFDEGYFLHCEDLDLCRRARDAGFVVVCANAVRVQHGKGGSSNHRPIFVSRHKHRGMWRWFAKFDPAARNRLLYVLVYVGIWTHFVLTLPLLAARQLLRARTPH